MQTVVAAIILSHDMRRILLTQRAGDKNFPFHWCHPGGKVEPGEMPWNALIRELQEEIGVTVKQAMELFDQRILEPPVCEESVRLITYVCLIPDGQRVMLLDATIGAGWFTPSEIFGLTVTPGLALLRPQLREKYQSDQRGIDRERDRSGDLEREAIRGDSQRDVSPQGDGNYS